jgi:hypothetical protein
MSIVMGISRHLRRLRRQNDLEKMLIKNPRVRHLARLTVALKPRTDVFDKAFEILSSDDPQEMARWQRKHDQRKRDYSAAARILEGDSPQRWLQGDRRIREATKDAGEDDWVLTGVTTEEMIAC